MAKKPTVDDAQLILQLYDLRREAEMRKARHWCLTEFWPKSAEDYVRVQSAMGAQENNWLRQVVSYWGLAANLVLKGAVNEELFFDLAFCGEMYFIYAKVRPYLKELRKTWPALFVNIEKAIAGSKVAKQQFAEIERRMAVMRMQK